MPNKKIETKPDKIKGCPFCGKKPKVRSGVDYIGTNPEGKRNVPYWFISCYKGRHHHIQVGNRHKKAAIKLWNKRSK